MLLTDGSGTVSWGAQPVAGLPSQTSNSGRLLTTNGSTASWSNAVTVSGSNATVGGTLTVSGGISVGTGSGLETTGWLAYQSDTRFLIRDQVNSQVAMDFIAGAAPYARAINSFLVLGTTASTSTSSGALVVSGGVGVAKRIYSGEGLDTAGDNATHISFVRNGTISIGPTSAATPKLQVGGGLLLANTSQSVPAWGDVGAQLSVAGAVLTDTSSSGTVSRVVVNSIASSALAASSTTTYTQAATLFISNAPTANTNVTITNAYALYTAGGRINFQGLPTSSAGLQAGTLWNDGGTLKVA
jgi:hypothetical protein